MVKTSIKWAFDCICLLRRGIIRKVVNPPNFTERRKNVFKLNRITAIIILILLMQVMIAVKVRLIEWLVSIL